MLTTEVAHPAAAPMKYRRLAKASTALALASLLGVCLLAAAHVHSPSSSLFEGAQLFAGVTLVSAAVASASWLFVYVSKHRELWKLVLLLLVLTTSVFAMHLYVINSPQLVTPGSVSGSGGTTFSDSKLGVDSNVTSNSIAISFFDLCGGQRVATCSDPSGQSSAISSLTVTYGGVALPDSGLKGAPSLASPLEPGEGVTGNWTLTSTSSNDLNVTYNYLTCYNLGDLTKEVSIRNAGYGCVMDEVYYVPSAQGILSGEQCAPYADNCNLEHPFLAKALIAGGMTVFGEYTTLGWRIANAVMGTLSIPLLFALVYLLSGNKRLSLISSLLLAADTMVFVHSSAALIDIPIMFFTLIAFVFYFWKASFWKIDRFVLTGVFLGLAMLAKETAVFMVGALLTYNLFTEPGRYRRVVWDTAKFVGVAAIVFFGGLQIYDSLYTAASTPYFYQQIEFMLSYGSSLKGPGWFDAVLGTYITPLNWITYYSPVDYLVTKVTTTITSGTTSATYTYVSVGFYGITNSIVVWLVFAWVPLVIYKSFKGRSKAAPATQSTLDAVAVPAPEPQPAPEQSDDKAGRFAVLWFLWGYVPYVLLWAYGRVTYPFYIISAIPALSLGAAYFVTRKDFPTKLTWIYLIAAFGWFFLYFPVKDFLPIWIRVLIGR